MSKSLGKLFRNKPTSLIIEIYQTEKIADWAKKDYLIKIVRTLIEEINLSTSINNNTTYGLDENIYKMAEQIEAIIP